MSAAPAGTLEPNGTVVIAGAGLAGLRTAEALRRRGFAGRVVLVGDEPHPPYERPVLSKRLLTGADASLPLLTMRPDVPLSTIDTAYGRPATAVDVARRTVSVAGGPEVAYDRLVVATGAQARRLPGLPDRLHRLRGYDDALALREALGRGGPVVIIGGGFIGCEVASSVRSLDLPVTIVEAQPEILVGVLGERVAAWVADLHRRNDVAIRAGVTVRAVTGSPGQWRVELGDGVVLEAGVVVEAVGARPMVEWLAGSGIDVADGVTCDEYGRTSAPGVYAVGDVASWHDPRTGRPHRHEHWTAAVEQADVVAGNLMAADGDFRPYASDSYVWSDQHGVRVQTVGTLAGVTAVEVLHADGERLLAAYVRDGLVTGLVGANVARLVTRLRPMVAQRAPLAEVERAVEALLVR